MLKLFKQNVLAQVVIIVIASLAMWLPSMLQHLELPVSVSNAFLFELVMPFVMAHPMVASIVGYLLVLAEGFWFNEILYRFKLIPQNTLLPMLAYVVAMSVGQEVHTLTPMVLANAAILGSCRQLLVPDTLMVSLDQLFNASFLVALATLLYLPCFTLLLPLVIIFTVHSLYRWRHWVMMLLGFVAPYILVATYYFVTDRLNYNFYLTKSDLFNIGFSTETPSVWGWIQQVFFIVFTLCSLLTTISAFGEQTTMNRKNATVICLPMIAGAMMLFYSELFPVNGQLFALPAAFVIAQFFLNAKPYQGRRNRSWVFSLLLILYIAIGF